MSSAINETSEEYLRLLISIKHAGLNLLILSFILIGGLVHASL